MSFFLKLVFGFILLLITISLWYVTIPIIALYILYRKRKSISSWYKTRKENIEIKRKESNLIRFNLPEYIAIEIFGPDWQNMLKLSDLEMYNYLTNFYTTQKSMSYIEKSFIPNVISLHCTLHDRLTARSKITPTVEFTQTYDLAQKYFEDCISNYEHKNKHEQENEDNSSSWHDRWNDSHSDSEGNSQSSQNNSQSNSQNNSHKSHSRKKSRKSAKKEAQIREKLNKFGISEFDAEVIFGKSWRAKLGKPDWEFFYTIQMIAINIEYDFDGRYRRKYGSLYSKVLEIIEIVTGDNHTNDYTNDYTNDDTNDYTDDSVQDDLKSAFDTLGLKVTSTMDEIKTRYRELMLKHHPDRNHGSQKSSQKTIEINNAYELIMGVKNTA